MSLLPVEALGGAPLLLLVAAVARTCGAAARVGDSILPLRLLGWLLASLGAWLAASAAGFLSPLWWPVLAGVLGWLLDFSESRRRLWTAADVAVVGLAASISIPAPPAWVLAGTALGVAGVGHLLDRTLGAAPPAVRVAGFVAPVLLLRLVFGVTEYGDELRERIEARLGQALQPSLAVVPVGGGQRLTLSTGDVAWLFRPSGSGPWPGALLLHGAHFQASRQRAAVLLRQALLDAGFVVLAVDHPGFGASPDPQPGQPLEAWDPLPTAVAAVGALDGLPETRGDPLLVGHSMGATDVLRLMDAWPRASGAVLLGATVEPRGPEAAFHLYERLVSDMQLDWDPGRAVVNRVRRRYYNNDRAVAALRSGHPPVLFVEFSRELEDIAATRGELWERIPGAKVRWRLRSSHHLDTREAADLLLADHRVARRLARGLRDFRSGRHPADGSRLGFRIE